MICLTCLLKERKKEKEGKADLIAALWGMSNEEIEKKEEMDSEMEEEEETSQRGMFGMGCD